MTRIFTCTEDLQKNGNSVRHEASLEQLSGPELSTHPTPTHKYQALAYHALQFCLRTFCTSAPVTALEPYKAQVSPCKTQGEAKIKDVAQVKMRESPRCECVHSALPTNQRAPSHHNLEILVRIQSSFASSTVLKARRHLQEAYSSFCSQDDSHFRHP